MVGSSFGGGEFSVYAPPGSNQPLFTTFCIEPNEHISLGSTYYVGSVTTTIKYNGGTQPIDLNTFSAFLFHEFARNSWSQAIFDYNDANARKADDELLQNAIWHFQYGGYGTATTNEFIKYAEDWASQKGWTGTGDVAVMNLWGDRNYTEKKQDQLTLVPEPTSLLLMGFGLVGLAGLRRKE